MGKGQLQVRVRIDGDEESINLTNPQLRMLIHKAVCSGGDLLPGQSTLVTESRVVINITRPKQ